MQEADVDDQHDRGRGEEVAHELIFAEPLGEGAGAALAVGHRQVHHFLEQLLAIFGVEPAADLVDQLRPGDPQDEIEAQCELTPIASTHRVGMALLGMTRS